MLQQWLARVPLVKTLDTGMLARIAEELEPVSVEPVMPIVSEGSPGDAAYSLQEGS
eukprot:SAG31_NODE_26574_length_440_cov_0.680352_2_plen_55_part_01